MRSPSTHCRPLVQLLCLCATLLATAAASAGTLSVAYCEQFDKTLSCGSCGSASTGMGLAYVGATDNPCDIQSWLYAGLPCGPGVSALTARANEYCSSHGLTSPCAASYDWSDDPWGHLVTEINEGRPFVAHVYQYNYSHYVLVSGWGDNQVLVDDPVPSHRGWRAWGEFSGQWGAKNYDGVRFLLNRDLCSTLPKPPSPPPTAPSEGLAFACGDSRRTTMSQDWDWGFSKAECGATQAATGLSRSASSLGYAHDLLCRADDAAQYPHTECRALVFEAADNRATTITEDWDWGFTKGECGVDEYVAGVSQSLELKLHALLCCRGAVNHSDCKALVFNGGDVVEGSLPNDWDWGNWKAECGPNRYVAGVSHLQGRPHGILCCGSTAANDAGGQAEASGAEEAGFESEAAAADQGVSKDAHSSIDSHSRNDAGAESGASATSTPAHPVNSGDAEGCGCRLARSRRGAGAGVLVLLGFLLGIRRKADGNRRSTVRRSRRRRP